MPEAVSENSALAEAFGAETMAKIINATGIERRPVSTTHTVSDLGKIAGEAVMARLDWAPESIGLIVVVTQTPDYPLPSTACVLQQKLGLATSTAALDINLGCSGYVYGLSVVTALMRAGGITRALLVAGDITTRMISDSNRSLAPLFGDAVAASALELDDAATLAFDLGSDGSGAPYLISKTGGLAAPGAPELFMEGTQVMAFSLKQVAPSVARALEAAGASIDDMDHVVLHQANAMMIKTLGHKIKARDDQMVFAVRDYGNTSSTPPPPPLDPAGPVRSFDQDAGHRPTALFAVRLRRRLVVVDGGLDDGCTQGARHHPGGVMSRLLVRTEASNAVGMGHFMRCFAIAEEARGRGIEVRFLLSVMSDPVVDRCRRIGATARATGTLPGEDAAIVANLLSPDDWLLIDSYAATADYVSTLHKASRVAVIDDLAALDHYDCDLIVNAAQSASQSTYRTRTQAKLLLGAPYALIRREFRNFPASPAIAPSVGVMFGGSDPRRLTGGCATMLRAALPGVTLKIIAGPAHIHTDELRALAEADPLMELHVDPPSVAQVLAGCDLVLTAAGGSVGEMAAMGLAALVLVLYDNQKAALAQCPFPVIDARDALPDDLGARARALIDDPAKRQAIAASAHKIVDGKGAQRIVETMFGA